MKRPIALVLMSTALGMLLLARPALAQEFHFERHTVKDGDTLELLAAEYYGDRRHAVFLMKANNMTHPKQLKRGSRIKIPRQLQITANVGDTLEGLAEEHMGDPRRARFLAEFNNLAQGSAIPAGLPLEIPFHVRHRAAAQEAIATIAATYLHDAKKAQLLKDYNFIQGDELAPGEVIVVPIYHVRVRSSKLPQRDQKSAEREARLREMEEQAIQALPRARTAWRNGEYDTVKRVLVELDLDYLPAELLVDVGVLLGAAYVAFDDEASATAIFDKVLRRTPGHAIRAYYFSPKIQAIWKKAGGTVDSEPP